MKRINTETRLYAQLARRGDPSAFYALQRDHIRSLYVLQRSLGKDHETACAGAHPPTPNAIPPEQTADTEYHNGDE